MHEGLVRPSRLVFAELLTPRNNYNTLKAKELPIKQRQQSKFVRTRKPLKRKIFDESSGRSRTNENFIESDGSVPDDDYVDSGSLLYTGRFWMNTTESNGCYTRVIYGTWRLWCSTCNFCVP